VLILNSKIRVNLYNKVTVDVADINDNAPVFRPAAIVRDISEAAYAGSGFVIPTAHDADTAEFGVVRYQLTDVDGRPASDDGPFGLSISRKLDGSTEVARTRCRVIAHDLLFDFNRNCASVLYRFRVIANHLPKVADFIPTAFSAPLRGDPVRISLRSLSRKTWHIVWRCFRDPTFIRFNRTPTCDGQTDR